MVRVAVSNGKPIPLTLTLSRGEREQPAAGSVVREVRRADTALGCAERQRRILPLPEGVPEGEGRGEGKGDARTANRVRISPEVCGSPEGPYGFEPFILSCLRLCRRSLTLCLPSPRIFFESGRSPTGRARRSTVRRRGRRAPERVARWRRRCCRGQRTHCAAVRVVSSV